VSRTTDVVDLLGTSWTQVLHHVEDGVLILDSQRILKFANQRARQLLGYKESQSVGGRCRLTTRGLDCENACPLTFALEGDLKQVENFSTVYHTNDGTPVPLSVTVIPLLDHGGEFGGAVEILRPTEPDPGFLLAGRSELSTGLRTTIGRLARTTDHVVFVGEAAVCADVARAFHRLSGIADALYHSWPGSWNGLPEWPPGTVFAYGFRVAETFHSN
jgi:transcriptional regulator with PAS, ATPase and Fis domain